MADGRVTISALVPAYNRAGTIGRALESVLAQQRRPDEIVVVDDGSTDETAAIVAAYGAEVTLVRADHGGVSSARNRAVEASGSDFAAFLDSDDYWDDDHLLRMDDAIRQTEGRAWLYFSDLRLAPLHGGQTNWALSDFRIEGDHELRIDGKQWTLLPRQPMMIPASTIRRDAYLAVGGSEPRLERRGDTHLFFKLGLGGPVCAVAGEAGIASEDASNSLTQTLSSDETVYWTCTTWLYADLLRHAEGLSARERNDLRRRLADAHLTLARRRGIGAPAVSHVARALRHDPMLVASRARRLVQGVRA
jgi:glycosyltransferase involved in cell wall biosynthesis